MFIAVALDAQGHQVGGVIHPTGIKATGYHMVYLHTGYPTPTLLARRVEPQIPVPQVRPPSTAERVMPRHKRLGKLRLVRELRYHRLHPMRGR